MKPSVVRTGTERIRSLFYCVIGVYFLGIFVGILTYGEPFRFFEYPISDLGATSTITGFPNTYANLAFAATMIACGILLTIIGMCCGVDAGMEARTLKCVLGITGGIGCFISIFPHDTYSLQHSVGAGFFVGSLYLFSYIFLRESKAALSRHTYLVEQLILQFSVVPYAIVWALNFDSKHTWQKLTLFGLSGIIIASVSQHVRVHRQSNIRLHPHHHR